MKFAQDVLADLRFGFGKKTPVILQSEASECGLACLAMIASHHGYEVDLYTLRRRFSSSLKGMNLARIIQIAGELRLEGRSLRLELEDLAKLRRPCILHWNLNHFVVLTKVTPKAITIIDPARGTRVMSWDEVSKAFTGVALELSPAADFAPVALKSAVSIRALTGRMEGLVGALFRIFTLALVLEIFGILGPLYIQWILDEVLVINDKSLLTILGIVYLAVTLFSAVFSGLRSWVIIEINATLGVQWAMNVFSHLMRLPLEFFEKRHIGDVVSRYEAVQNICQTITTSFVSAVLDGIMGIAILVVIALYSLRLTAIVLAVFLIYLTMRWIFFYPLRAATERHIYAAAKRQTYLLESIRGIQTLKLFNHEGERTAKFSNHLVDTINQSIRVQQLTALFHVGQQFLSGIAHVVLIWLAALMVMHNTFAVGMLVAYATYASQLLSRGDGLVNAFIEFRMLRLYGERLADIALHPTEAHAIGSYLGTDPEATISIRHLSFRYAENDPWILQDVRLEIPAGSAIAIIGPSGSGKSTLVKLLLGLLSSQEGEIRIGEIDIRQLGFQRYRSFVAAVMQNDQLLAGSIADNIALAHPEADLSEVVKAAQMAGIHEEIAAMPMGYQTLVGDMGSTLSGGQKQRVLLARALFTQPKILILDEATSHLDVFKEMLVNQHIRQMQITRIIVAHRPETILQCELIYQLLQGSLQPVTPEQFRKEFATVRSALAGSLAPDTP